MRRGNATLKVTLKVASHIEVFLRSVFFGRHFPASRNFVRLFTSNQLNSLYIHKFIFFVYMIIYFLFLSLNVEQKTELFLSTQKTEDQFANSVCALQRIK